MAAEQFKQFHGLDIVPVHYRGAAPALQDVVAGHASMMFDIVPLTKEQLAAGKVRALAITSAQRGAAVPDVPTMVEAGMPEVQGGPWFGLFAPAGTPRPVIDWINAEARKVFSMPDVRDRLVGQGLTLPLGSPEDFGKHVADETKRWGEVIRSATSSWRVATAIRKADGRHRSAKHIADDDEPYGFGITLPHFLQVRNSSLSNSFWYAFDTGSSR